MYDKMVTDNGHWNYCSSILRRKGRKRCCMRQPERSHHRTFPDYFFLGSRLLYPMMQQPRECQRKVNEKSVGGQIYGYRCTISVKNLLWFFIVFIFLNCTSLPSVYAATQDYRPLTNSSGRICSSLDIRNTAESFRQLTDCRVIEGFLQIVLMDRTNESHFANLTFPNLREITGYLLLYRVNGLRSLVNLFPNLSIIRGHHLFINYALAVYEMLHLQELGLHSLTDIPRGAVFITKNPLLCYIDTIDWPRITTSGKDLNFIFENRQSNACPKCPTFNSSICGYNNSTKQSYCWNAQYCQRTCPNCSSNRCSIDGECCHESCLGGCDGSKIDQCHACKNVILEVKDANGTSGKCVEKCPPEYYKYKDRRCITSDECYAMPKPKEDLMGVSFRPNPWKPFNDSCIIECPPGYEEELSHVKNNEKFYKCEKCKGACRKVCDAANVDSIQSAQRLKGCVVINGSLEIQIRGGGNIVKELEDSLNMIEEITGYLKVVRSLSLVSLNFLRSLKLIKGDNLENGKYVLVVLDNQNLAELWDFSRRRNDLKIGKGRIFFHFNPKLCIARIRELQKRLGIREVDDLEVAPNSNGDKVACNITELNVSVSTTRHDMVLLTWTPYVHYEMRTLLGYVVYVMEAPHMNVSMNDGRDACGVDGWKVYDVEVPDPTNSSTKDNITHPITHLKPYTQYAYYVKTYTIATETNGAQSKIDYFRTNPATPTPPRQLKITSYTNSEILIEWQPPEVANGNLTHYIIYGELAEDQSSVSDRNYCTEPLDIEKSIPKEERKKPFIPEKKIEECNCPAPENQPKIKKNDQEVQALIEFENKLHDNIYVKNVPSTGSTTRNRRAISSSNGKEYNLRNDNRLLHLESNELAGNSTDPSAKLNDASVNITGNSSRFRYIVASTTHSIEVKELKHFSHYSVTVQACREKIATEAPSPPPSCSTEKMENIQTLPLEYADRIDPLTVDVEILNDTSGARLRWAEPKTTNGPILTYVIQYKRMDFENQQAQFQCVTSAEFRKNNRQYSLKSLMPGNYSVMIKATSLAKDIGNTYTPPFYFLIQENDRNHMNQVLLGIFFGFFVLILGIIIMCLTVRYFYPNSWYQRKLLFASVNPEYFKPVEGYDKWEISRKKIVLDNLLGIGHFGEVYEGRAKGIIQKGITTKVAVKTLNKSPTNHRTWMSFLNEASVMKQFDTHHVVRLLGVVTKGEPLVIMELMAKGDLRTYLRSCREDIPEEERRGPLQPPPTLKEILQMAVEISDGMLYLADKKFVHRDLAARNCMINAEGTVKIGDFGLTRDVYETDYYRKDSKGHLPVRWMAPESLRDGIFTSRSDVWSYGVVLWEMATLASLPYTGLGNGEVMPFVINGGVMEEPENCPSILSELMKACWQYKYIHRPSFSEILEILLPNIGEGFEEVSYYHTEEAKQLRASNAEAVAEEDTPYTPLRIMEDFEDFSLDSDDNEEENETENAEPRTLNEANTSSGNASVRSLPTVNGYIRRPHLNLIPLVNTKTTPC